MSQILILNNGKSETIFSPRNFEDLIDRYLGVDSANYYHCQIQHLVDLIEEHLMFIEDENEIEYIRGELKDGHY